MKSTNHYLQTERLILRPWKKSDLLPFSEMHDDPVVMADLDGRISMKSSKEKLRRYSLSFKTLGYGRWCVVDRQNSFVGYVGISHHDTHHALGEHDEIGWRLNKKFWGLGLASEAAKAALLDGFTRLKMKRVWSCTSPTNTRSQAVMERLSMQRAFEHDFNWTNSDGSERPVLVWSAKNT